MSVFVLGHRGMLGHVVVRCLRERGHQVHTSEHRYVGTPRDALIEAVRSSGCAWIVNAAGRIKQKPAAPEEMFLVNARLPVHLAARMLPEQRLVHASTDCVFSGERGAYRVDEQPDASDPYGFSKALGEAAAAPGRCVALRTSILGPELTGAHGLMAWFLSQRQPVDGFANHRWNGITTLEWAKVCAALIERGLPERPILQLASPAAVSKYELLRMIAATWPGCAEVRRVDAPQALDRTLVPQIVCTALGEQLSELRRWYA